MVEVCKCCGHPLPEVGVLVEMTRGQRAMFKVIQKAGQAGIDINTLVERVYADNPEGGPAAAKNVMHVHRIKMEENLTKFGLKITTTKGHHAFWRLEKK